MRHAVAAFAALAFACAPGACGAETELLTLEAAFARVESSHPELRVFEPRAAALRAELDRAALKPGWTATGELENVPGTGPSGGLEAAELTLSLATVLERGGKRDARRAVAHSRIDALAAQREAQRLDLLAEVARRYVAAVAAREQHAIAARDVEQRTRAVVAARARWRAGASPESVVLTAEAWQARAELDRDRAAQRYESTRRHLASLWGDAAPTFGVADLDASPPPEIADLAWLERLIAQAPELQQFAGEQRVREARLQLARSDASADLSWAIGVRRREAEDDVGVVASLSVPLGTRSRAQPGIRAAEAELVALGLEREAKATSLRATLVEAHGRYGVARLEARRYREDVLPRLARAEAAAERAYRGGASSYLEWSQVQSERTAASRERLAADIDAQRALIELQRLTAQPFVLAPATPRGTEP